MTEFQTGIIALLRSALTDTPVQLPDNFDFAQALQLGKEHQILPLLFYGIENAHLPVSEDVRVCLRKASLQGVMLDQMQQQRAKELFAAFEEHGIDYMPLKGILLKQDYPHPEMRPMGDLDVLIKPSQYDQIRPIMEQLGYREGVESDHELVWSCRTLMIELHKRIMPSYNPDFFAYFGDGWQLAKPVDGYSHRFAMSAEDGLIYNLTHMAKHYRDGGIGIRHVLDVAICRKDPAHLDLAYVHRELKKLQLEEFYENVCRTAAVWLEGMESDVMTDLMTSYIFTSGCFGTETHKALAAAVRASRGKHVATGRYKRLMQVVFCPYEIMCKRYPFLKKAPALLPAFWVVRGIDAIANKRTAIKKQADTFKTAMPRDVDAFHQSLSYVGLDFNFEE